MPLLVTSGGTGISAGLFVAFAVTLAFVRQTGQDKPQVLGRRLGHGSTNAFF